MAQKSTLSASAQLEILKRIFTGDAESNRRYQEQVEEQDRGYSRVLGVPVETIQKMRKEGPMLLIERVVLKKSENPYWVEAVTLRALSSMR